MDISAGASAANLNGRKLVELNDAWLDSDLTVTLEDVGAEMEKGKVCDQFEAYHKLTGRRATYDGSLYATSLDTSKVGCKKGEAIDPSLTWLLKPLRKLPTTPNKRKKKIG